MSRPKQNLPPERRRRSDQINVRIREKKTDPQAIKYFRGDYWKVPSGDQAKP
jgi:hypothetical protein